MEKIKCPKCDGEGLIENPSWIPYIFGYEPGYIECDQCEGTGYIKVTTDK